MGTFRATGAGVRGAVHAALAATPAPAVLHVDSASIYRNEEDIAAALDGTPRSRVFLTSKLSPYETRSEEAASEAAEGILRRLRVTQLDLLLVHWPGVAKADAKSPANAAARAGAWRVLERLHGEGRVRCLGVSNYTEAHLRELWAHCRVKPVVNQGACVRPECAAIRSLTPRGQWSVIRRCSSASCASFAQPEASPWWPTPRWARARCCSTRP